MIAMEYQTNLIHWLKEMPGTTTGPRKRSFKGTFNAYTYDLKLQSWTCLLSLYVWHPHMMTTLRSLSQMSVLFPHPSPSPILPRIVHVMVTLRANL